MRTLLTDRMLAGYHALGRHAEAQVRLSKVFSRDIDLEEIFAMGEEATDLLRTRDGSRTCCYVCGRPWDHALGRLCPCYREVVVQAYYDTRDTTTMFGLPPNEVVECNACERCGIPHTVRARRVQRWLRRGQGPFRSPRLCRKHYEEKKKGASA